MRLPCTSLRVCDPKAHVTLKPFTTTQSWRQPGLTAVQTPDAVCRCTRMTHTVCARMQGAYLTLGQFTMPQHWRNAAIILTVVALGGSGLWAYSTVTETQKRQKYQRAYEEVQKMK